MLNINQKVEVVLSPNNMQYYKDKGYDIDSLKQKRKNNKFTIPKGTIILVNLIDLPSKSSSNIHIQCDYCGKDIIKEYRVYNIQKEKSYLKKDTCENCRYLKVIESNMIRYGNKTHFIRPDIENIEKQFKERKYTLISNQYINLHDRLDYICLKHQDKGIQQIAYAQFRIGQGCNYCGHEKGAKKQRNDYSNFKEEFIEEGLFPITQQINTSKDYVEYICLTHKNKGVQKIRYNKFNQGQGCKFCAYDNSAEKCRHNINYVKDKFEENGYILVTDFYINNRQTLEYICKQHKDVGIQITNYNNILKGCICKYCYKENHSGENHWNWNGGTSELKTLLYSKITSWKKETMKASNYKCVITNKRFDDIHHLYGFSFIFKEIFEELNIELRNEINQYTNDELKQIEEKCLELHYKHGLGVCLSHEIHVLIHKEYGFGRNTPEQFEEFKQRYCNGEFEDELNEVSI